MIDIRHVGFGYEKNHAVLKDISLELKTGFIYGLLGRNGAGKTSLLKIMSALLFPKKGECYLDDQRLSKRTTELLQKIYFVPEEFQLPAISQKQYLELYSPFYPSFNNDLYEMLMDEFTINSYKILTTLSYGQKKKFMIGFALATNCECIIFDEPTNGLDIPSKSQFREIVASTMSDDKLYIISTHQIHDIENLIDSVLILDNGEIVADISTKAIAEQFYFDQQSNEPVADDCCYFEKTISGYNVIKANTSQHESNIDLELYFNMLVGDKKTVKQMSGDKQK